MEIEVIGKSFAIEKILIDGEELKNGEFTRIRGELFKKYNYKGKTFLLQDGTKNIMEVNEWKELFKKLISESKHSNELERNKAMLFSLEREEF